MRDRSSLIFPGIAVVLLVPVFVLSPYRLGLLALVAAYALASLAQNLLSGYADIPSLGNVAFFAASAFVAGALMTTGSAPPIVAVPGGVLAAGFLGFVAGLPALRVSGMHFAIVTLALVFVVQEIMVQWTLGHSTGGSGGVSATGPTWLLGDNGLYIAAVLISVLCYYGLWNLLGSRAGRALLAVSDSPHAASAVGIDPRRYRLLAFLLSGLLTGVAGAVYLYYARTVTPTGFTLDLSLAFLTMMILGGSRSLPGSALGALIIGLLPQALGLLPAHIGSLNVQDSASGLYAILLLLALRFFPEGIWNAVAYRARRSPAIRP